MPGPDFPVIFRPAKILRITSACLRMSIYPSPNAKFTSLCLRLASLAAANLTESLVLVSDFWPARPAGGPDLPCPRQTLVILMVLAVCKGVQFEAQGKLKGQETLVHYALGLQYNDT